MVFDNAAGAAHRVAWDRITIVDVFHGLLSATASRSGLCFSKLASAL